MRRIRASGAKDADITELVRGLQKHVLFGVCNTIDGVAIDEAEVAGIQWNIFEVDENFNPVLEFSGLSDYVNETDPGAIDANGD